MEGKLIHSMGEMPDDNKAHRVTIIESEYGVITNLCIPQKRDNPPTVIEPLTFGFGDITSDLHQEFAADADQCAQDFHRLVYEEDAEHEMCPDCQTSRPIGWSCPACGVDVAKGDAAADALESFLLALACEGVDISSPPIKQALKTAVEAIGNNL